MLCDKNLAVHQIELVVNAREDFGNGRAVGNHTAGTHDLGQITTRHHRWRLVVDAALEASGAPIHELDGALGLDGGNCRVHVLWYNISAVPGARSGRDQAQNQGAPTMLNCQHVRRRCERAHTHVMRMHSYCYKCMKLQCSQHTITSNNIATTDMAWQYERSNRLAS